MQKRDYTWKDAAFSAGLGCVGGPVASKVVKPIASKVAGPVANQTKKVWNWGASKLGGLFGKNAFKIKNVTVVDNGQVAYRGTIDISPTIKRVERGIRDAHRNDGAVFQNRGVRPPLPKKSAPMYYREYVHRTAGAKVRTSAGPERVILGRGGEVYYTPDHYRMFIRVK